MANDDNANALTIKVAELRSQIKVGLNNLQSLNDQLANAQNALLAFAYDVGSDGQSKRHPGEVRTRKSQVVTLLCDAIRTAGRSLSELELAEKIASARGVEMSDKTQRRTFLTNIRNVLGRRKDIFAKDVQPDGTVLWRFTKESRG